VVSGNAVTFTWSTQHADACVASGGGANDTWPGNRPANGSVSVVEPSAVSVPTNLTFTLTCSSSVSGKTAITSAVVTLNPAPPPREGGGGGGGSLDALWLMMLAGAIAMRGRQPGARGPGSRH
jgi:hypothetical protein